MGRERKPVFGFPRFPPTVISTAGFESRVILATISHLIAGNLELTPHPHETAKNPKFTSVCSYDRAGFGWSDLHESPRSAVQIAEELHLLLSNAAVTGPYVLAGHSMGGLYSRAFARKFPESVIGLVLVDATHEDQWDFEPKQFWRFEQPIIQIPQPPVERPADVAAILREMWATDKWKTGERQERDSIGATISDAQKNPKRLPPIPLIVLSAGAEIRWNEGASAGALKGQQLQRELAVLSPLGRWVPIPGANHYVHQSQPAAVIDAIREVVRVARSMRRSEAK